VADRPGACPAELDRPHDPGDRTELSLPGGRRGGGRVRIQLSRHRPGAGVRGRQPGYPGDPVHRGGSRRVLRVREHRLRRQRAAGHTAAQDPEVAMAGSAPAVPPAAAPPPVAAPGAAPTAVRTGRHPWLSVLWSAARTPRGAAGLTMALLVLLVAVIGPAVSPPSPNDLVTLTFAKPSGQYPLGGDFLGRDVLSRVLNGGWLLLLMAVAATAIGIVAGAAAGMAAAYLPGAPDGIIMRTVDVILAFPQLVFALLLLGRLGPKLWLIVLAVGLSHAPAVARVIRSATLDIAERDYVKVAELQGMRPVKVMAKEILPNLISPLMVEAGLRLTYSIVIIAGL